MKYRRQIYAISLFLTILSVLLWRQLRPTMGQQLVVEAARGCLGYRYDNSAFPGGPAPPGRGACTDVVYRAYLPVLDLQQAVNLDMETSPSTYPAPHNKELDFRWCPKLILWFRRNAESLPTELGWNAVFVYRPGDVVFYDDGAELGVPGHVGVVSDRWSWDGKPLLIHNPGPVCVEENALGSHTIVGHFRLPALVP